MVGGGGSGSSSSSQRRAVLASRAPSPVARRPAAGALVGGEQRQHRGATSTSRHERGPPVLADPRPRARTAPAPARFPRAVLAPLAALILPVVGRRVQAHQVGRGGGVVEHLGDVLVGVGVRLLGSGGPDWRHSSVQRQEPIGRRVAERVAPLDQGLDEDPPAGGRSRRRRGLAAEAHAAIDRPHLVTRVVGGHGTMSTIGSSTGRAERRPPAARRAGSGPRVPRRPRRRAGRHRRAPRHGHGPPLPEGLSPRRPAPTPARPPRVVVDRQMRRVQGGARLNRGQELRVRGRRGWSSFAWA